MKTWMLLLAMLSAVLCAVAAPPIRKGARKSGETVITASRMEYDYTESAVLFEENVKVVDPEFTMTADRVIVLLEGTNNLKQVRCLGNVVLVSEDRSARCAEAMSKAISVGWISSAKLTPFSSKASRIGVQRRAKSAKP